MKLFGIIFGLCPGFSGLIRYGRFPQLFISLLFLAALSAVALVDFFWIELIPSGTKKWTFVLLGAIWVLLSYISDCFSRHYEKIEQGDANGTRYLEVLTVYLRGEWNLAEKMAKDLLKLNSRDVEAALFLATLYRHTKRFAEAFRMHRILDNLGGADRWYYEIFIEKAALNKAVNGQINEIEDEEDEKSEVNNSEQLDEIEENGQGKIGESDSLDSIVKESNIVDQDSSVSFSELTDKISIDNTCKQVDKDKQDSTENTSRQNNTDKMTQVDKANDSKQLPKSETFDKEAVSETTFDSNSYSETVRFSIGQETSKNEEKNDQPIEKATTKLHVIHPDDYPDAA